MNFLNGSNFLIWIDVVTPITNDGGNDDNYRPVVCGTSNGFNMSAESISLRNKEDGGFDNSESGYISWGFDLDGYAVGLKNSEKLLKANFNEIASLFLNRTKFWAKQVDLMTSVVREGVVRIGDFKETANQNQPYSFTANFIGQGKPFLSENIYKTVLATVPNGDTLLITKNNELIQTS